MYIMNTFPKTNVSPENRPPPKGQLFQFSGTMLVSGRVQDVYIYIQIAIQLYTTYVYVEAKCCCDPGFQLYHDPSVVQHHSIYLPRYLQMK